MNAQVVEGVNAGRSHVKDVPAREVAAYRERGLLEATTDMARLIDWGVDGLITDRPDILRNVMAEKKLPLPKATPVAS